MEVQLTPLSQLKRDFLSAHSPLVPSAAGLPGRAATSGGAILGEVREGSSAQLHLSPLGPAGERDDKLRVGREGGEGLRLPEQSQVVNLWGRGRGRQLEWSCTLELREPRNEETGGHNSQLKSRWSLEMGSWSRQHQLVLLVTPELCRMPKSRPCVGRVHKH